MFWSHNLMIKNYTEVYDWNSALCWQLIELIVFASESKDN